MKPEDILQYCLANLEGTVRTESWGESGIFYNPGGVLKRGVYVLTVKEKDGANDAASRLDRPGFSAPCPPVLPRGAWRPWTRISPPRTALSPTRYTPGWAGPPC